MTAKETLKPVQSGLKGTNTQKDVVALLRWGISAKALGKAQGKQREMPFASLKLSGSTLPNALL